MLKEQLQRLQLRYEQALRCYSLMYALLTPDQRKEFIRLGRGLKIHWEYKSPMLEKKDMLKIPFTYRLSMKRNIYLLLRRMLKQFKGMFQ